MEGFRNRGEYGFGEDGCIRGYEEMVRAYLGGELNEKECMIIDKHLLSCRKCENAWDARVGDIEEREFPSEIEDDSDLN